MVVKARSTCNSGERLCESMTSGTDPVAVYLTDGVGSFPREAPLFPVLWVGLPGGRDVYPFGELVKMEDAVQ